MAVHILSLNQGSTAFDKSENVAQQLVNRKKPPKGTQPFINYLSDYKLLKTCLRNRSYCRRAVAVHILSLNQGSTAFDKSENVAQQLVNRKKPPKEKNLL